VRSAWGVPLLAASLLFAGSAAAFEARAPRTIAARGTVEVAFSPRDDAQAVLLRAVAGARKEIYVQSYLFTSRAIAAALEQAMQRGVRVAVLADAGANRQRGSQIPKLAAAGIAVAIETAYANAHNKVIVVDPHSEHCAVVTGSYNFTRSARERNAENLLVLRGNRPLALAYLENWQRHRAQAMSYDEFARQNR